MRKIIYARGWGFLTASLLTWLGCSVLSGAAPIQIRVDARDASRNILHARLVIPAVPGNLTLVYPKWIPGEHGPTGPITDLAGLKMSSAGRPIDWRRDADDMYAFHVEVPPGGTDVTVELDYLVPPSSDDFSSGAATSARLMVLNWNQVLLYPKGDNPETLQFAPVLHLPAGWRFGTALSPDAETRDGMRFHTVSLETLVDSPVSAGAYFRSVDLNRGAQPGEEIDIVADSVAALEMKPDDAARFSRLMTEATALFGARHYRSYHFLLTLSDHVAHFGLEHHESSDDRLDEKFLTDEDTRKMEGDLLPHELVHSWNGKYRRPAGLATADYQQPMKTELLWVYEGLTDYLGEVLAARSGLWTNVTFRERFALSAGALDHEPGRDWRPLSDTAVAAQLLYESRREGAAWRRSVDFYPEGDLIWLEADVMIRRLTQGKRSLDDFCREFFGGQNSAPRVVPYTEDDLLKALNAIAVYDWREFFRQRVYEINPRAPIGGIEGAGWRLAYTNEAPDLLKTRESARKYTDLTCSLGFLVKEDGNVLDVISGSPAGVAGLGPAMKLVAVNQRRWTPEILHEAVKAAVTNRAPMELLVENDDYFKTCRVDYHGGEKYPCLERDATRPDLLAQILAPRTPVPAAASQKR